MRKRNDNGEVVHEKVNMLEVDDDCGVNTGRIFGVAVVVPVVVGVSDSSLSDSRDAEG